MTQKGFQMKSIIQERLKKLYNYEPKTGIFTKKKTRKVASSMHNGYIRITIDYKDYYAHRLAFLYMNGIFPESIVDHKNHIKSDNRWSNLRIVSHQENCKNFPMNKNNSSGENGVYWHARDNRWIAFIYIDGKKKHIGCFKNREDAASARTEANLKYGYHVNHGKKQL